MTALTLAAAAALTAAVAVVPAADALEPAPAAVVTETVEVELNSEAINVAWGHFGRRETRSFGKHECPSHARYLDTTEYHPNSGWAIPRGVSITQSSGADLSSVTIPPQYVITEKGLVASGMNSALLTNGAFSYNTVYVYLHCTNQKPTL